MPSIWMFNFIWMSEKLGDTIFWIFEKLMLGILNLVTSIFFVWDLGLKWRILALSILAFVLFLVWWQFSWIVLLLVIGIPIVLVVFTMIIVAILFALAEESTSDAYYLD